MKLHHTEEAGDNIIFTHVQDIAPVMDIAEDLRLHTDNGWTDTRNMQCLADIPDIVFFNHPEFYNDDNALRKWLESDEGRPFRVATPKNKITSRVRVK